MQGRSALPEPPVPNAGSNVARLAVFATVVAMLFGNLGAARLFDRDEALNASCGREMFEGGDLVVPTFNGELRTAKPALIYWLMSASYATFGVSEFAARFFSAVASLGTLVCLYLCGRMLFGERTGLKAALVLMTGLLFAAVGRACTPDPFLVFSITLAMTCFVAGVVRKNGRFGVEPHDSSDPRSTLPDLAWWCATSAALGLAVLAKGPVGVVLPTGIIGLYLLWATDARRDRSNDPTGAWWQRTASSTMRFLSPARIWRCGWAMRPLTMFAIVLLIATPWYVMVGLRTGGTWLQTFLGHDNVGRFLRPLEGHGGPIVYYIPAILVGLFPWSPFLPAALVGAWKAGGSTKSDENPPADADAHRFVLCWAGLVVLFFSLAGTKLPNYVLPAYPALALLVARQLDRWFEAAAETKSLTHGAIALATCGLLLSVAAAVATHLLLPGYEWLVFVGLPSLAAGTYAVLQVRSDRRPRAVTGLLAGSVLCTVGLMAVAAPAVSGEQDGVLVGRDALDRSGRAKLGTFHYFTPNLVFYSGGQVETFATPQDAAAHLANDPAAVLAMPEDQWDNLAPHLPRGAKVVSRHREFLKKRTLLLVASAETVQPVALEPTIKR